MKKNNDLIYGNKNRYWTELKFNVKRMNGWMGECEDFGLSCG